jgi:trimeric autotransporter adhesin
LGSSSPCELTVYNDKLFFQASGGSNGHELWTYDGTDLTEIDINTGSGNSYPYNFCVYNDKLYFSAENDVNGDELWVYND